MRHPTPVPGHQVAQAKNPAAYYQEMLGKPAPEDFKVPNPAEITAFHKLMSSAEEALRRSPDTASARLKALQESVKTLHPFFQEVIPSFTHINEARIEIQTARTQLLKAVAAKPN